LGPPVRVAHRDQPRELKRQFGSIPQLSTVFFAPESGGENLIQHCFSLDFVGLLSKSKF